MGSKQPDALRLADELERDKWHVPGVVLQAAADELRRLHAENTALQSGYDAAMMEIASLQSRLIHANEQHRLWFARSQELEYQIDAVGAGGVEPLRKRECLHQIGEPAQIYSDVQRDAERYRWLFNASIKSQTESFSGTVCSPECTREKRHEPK